MKEYLQKYEKNKVLNFKGRKIIVQVFLDDDGIFGIDNLGNVVNFALK